MDQVLQLWLVEIEIWRLQRESAALKLDSPESEDTTTLVDYPKGEDTACSLSSS